MGKGVCIWSWGAILATLFCAGGLWGQPFQASTAFQQCIVCEEALTGPFYTMNTPFFTDPQPVCSACAKIQRYCFVCNLPVKKGAQTLTDGRLLCPRHARTAVLSAAAGESVFREVKRDVMRMFAGMGRMPDQNVRIHLIDRVELRRLCRGKPWINAEVAVGVTETTPLQEGQARHEIFLLTGLPHAHFAAVAAHEYTHTWVAENVTRPVSAKTVEGFCELVAYKLMTERREESQRKVILANLYTEGQIETFRQAEDNYQFHRVADWMKRGRDQAMTEEDPMRVLALSSSALPRIGFSPEAKTPVPETLELRGISGTAQRRFALVNDRTLEKSESAKVRVGSTNLTVRCLEITERSVRLKVLDTGEVMELSLRQKVSSAP